MLIYNALHYIKKVILSIISSFFDNSVLGHFTKIDLALDAIKITNSILKNSTLDLFDAR